MKQLKKALLVFIILAWILDSFAQSSADSISITFPKVLFVNEKGELLLAFDNSRKAYEVPANGFIEGPIAFRQYINELAEHIGVIYDSYRLGGIFTYIFPNRYRTFIRPYFVVEITGYANGESIINDRYRWFSLDEVAKEIKYPALLQIVDKIINHPEQVWCATFEEHGYTNPVDVGKIIFRIIEDFHAVN